MNRCCPLAPAERRRSSLHRVYQEHPSKAEFAALAPLVIAAAAAGDAVAQAIVAEAAAELALAVAAVVQRLGFGGAVPCAVAGGLIVGSPLLQEGFLAEAAQRGLQLEPVTPVVEPAVGAVRLALAARSACQLLCVGSKCIVLKGGCRERAPGSDPE